MALRGANALPARLNRPDCPDEADLRRSGRAAEAQWLDLDAARSPGPNSRLPIEFVQGNGRSLWSSAHAPGAGAGPAVVMTVGMRAPRGRPSRRAQHSGAVASAIHRLTADTHPYLSFEPDRRVRNHAIRTISR